MPPKNEVIYSKNGRDIDGQSMSGFLWDTLYNIYYRVAIKKVPIPISAIFSFDCNARNTKFCRKLNYVISDGISKFDAVSIKIVHFRAILLFTLLTGQSDHVSTGICITCLLAFAYDVESH